MTILFDATQKVKTGARKGRRFGAGLFAYVPTTRISHSHADEAEYSQRKADHEQAVRDFNEALEDRYHRFVDNDRMSRGVGGC